MRSVAKYHPRDQGSEDWPQEAQKDAKIRHRLTGSYGLFSHQAVTPKSGQQPSLVFAGEFVAPDTHHAPAGAAEGAVDEKVAGLVLGNLGLPELRVGFGLCGVDRINLNLDTSPYVCDPLTNGANREKPSQRIMWLG